MNKDLKNAAYGACSTLIVVGPAKRLFGWTRTVDEPLKKERGAKIKFAYFKRSRALAPQNRREPNNPGGEQ